MLLDTVQVTPPLAALHTDDLNMAMFTPDPKTFVEDFFSKTWNTYEMCSFAREAKSTAIRTSTSQETLVPGPH